MVKNAVPAFIEKGRTTKEDVLLGMGEPDGVGYAERWFAYGCIHGQGGAMLVLCAGGGCGSAGLQQVEYRRLIVTFDAANVVSEVVLETKTCTRTEGDIAGKDDLTEIPCLNVKGEDLL